VTARENWCLAALLAGVMVFVVGVVSGLVAAYQFRDFVQFGHHVDGACTVLPGRPGSPVGLAWVAVAAGVVGLLVSLGAVLGIRRPALLYWAFVVAGSSVVSLLLNVSVLHAMIACAPYSRV
jgi:hypothetical protein